MDRAPDLYFMHIPKTAGTALQQYLARHYRAAEVCPHQVWPELLADGGALSGYRLFMGHFFNVQALIDRRLPTISFVRDPLERAVSQFGHICRDPYHHLHDYAGQSGFDLDRFLQQPKGRNHLANYQSRHLAASDLPIQTEKPARVLDQLNKWGDDQVEEKALAAIDRFVVVGTVEEMDLSVNVIAARFGFPPAQLPQANVGWRRPATESISDRARDILDEITSIDRTVHRHATNALLDAAAIDVENLARSQAVVSQEWSIGELATDGAWHEVEPIGEATLRWTGHGDAKLRVPGVGMHRTVLLRLLGSEVDHLSEATVAVEGDQANQVMIAGSSLEWEMGPAQEIVVLSANVKSVPGDARALALPITGLKLTPVPRGRA